MQRLFDGLVGSLLLAAGFGLVVLLIIAALPQPQRHTGSAELIEDAWVKERRINQANYERQLEAERQMREALDAMVKDYREKGCVGPLSCELEAGIKKAQATK
jgi:hypothetical protein